MVTFMRDTVLPSETEYRSHRRASGPDGHDVPPVVERLRAEARARGLWNLFLPAESGLTQLEYAPIAELSGWSLELAPEAINCAAPDTGNMELVHLLGTEEHKGQWLEPLLEGEIRSAFAMTEPDVATATPPPSPPGSSGRATSWSSPAGSGGPAAPWIPGAPSSS
ncbi:hypothetical protein [Geodermatophilus amargosae]|uniref:hypothetical protein n=1 Tax=Geodermatophilus amargosae TaxID=1296565 RepID=UPI0034E03B87